MTMLYRPADPVKFSVGAILFLPNFHNNSLAMGMQHEEFALSEKRVNRSSILDFQFSVGLREGVVIF
jgi:hypothetical protein